MTPDRNQAARELLAFYLEAGVDAVLGETAVDRFAGPAELSPPPASGRPALDRTAEPQSGNRPVLDRNRPAAPTVAASPGPLPPDSAVMAAREEAKNAKTLDELRSILDGFTGCTL